MLQIPAPILQLPLRLLAKSVSFNYYLANSGNYLLLLILIIITYYSLATGHWSILIRSLFIASISLFVGTLIKNFFYLPRPFIISGQTPLVNYLMDGSFPSDHAAVAFALTLPFFLQQHKLGTILLFLSTLVALSRIVAGVHTLYDVLAGFAVALILTLVTLNARLLKRWHFH